jgi:hypothetical protein
MPRVKQSQLARARGGNEMSQSVAARLTRNKMRADWDTVRAMLTDPKTPRHDAQGRDVFQVWADMVLANPAAEYARAARDILPAEAQDKSNSSVVNNIQALYLTAVQQAQHAPDPRVVDASALTQMRPLPRRGMMTARGRDENPAAYLLMLTQCLLSPGDFENYP